MIDWLESQVSLQWIISVVSHDCYYDCAPQVVVWTILPQSVDKIWMRIGLLCTLITVCMQQVWMKFSQLCSRLWGCAVCTSANISLLMVQKLWICDQLTVWQVVLFVTRVLALVLSDIVYILFQIINETASQRNWAVMLSHTNFTVVILG